VVLVPAVAEAWHDQPPVLFFEYDHRLSRLAGNEPLAVWDRLAALGYRDVALWDNGGRPLGRTTVEQIPTLATELDEPQAGRDVRYWDVAVAHVDDVGASAVLAELVPALLAGPA
jgi:hypothetical protein